MKTYQAVILAALLLIAALFCAHGGERVLAQAYTGGMLELSQTWSGNNTFSGTTTFTGPVIVGTPPVGCTVGLAAGANLCGITAVATGVSANTDGAGHLTMSSGTATYTFAGTYTVAPSCWASDQTSIAAVKVVPSTTTVIFTTSGSSDVVNYGCTFLK